MGNYQIRFNLRRAPTIDVKVGWSQSALKSLERSYGPDYQVPSPEMYEEALIDTGAHRSFISHRIVEAYDLKPTGYAAVHSPIAGGDPIEVLLFPVSFRLARKTGDGWRLFGLASDVEAGLLPPGGKWSAPIIGRDVLSICRSLYDGPEESLTLYADQLPGRWFAPWTWGRG